MRQELAKRKGVWITNEILSCCPPLRLVFAYNKPAVWGEGIAPYPRAAVRSLQKLSTSYKHNTFPSVKGPKPILQQESRHSKAVCT